MSDLKNFSTGEVIFLKKDFDMWVHICFSFITSIFLKASKRLAWYVDSDETDVKQIPVKKKKKKKKNNFILETPLPFGRCETPSYLPFNSVVQISRISSYFLLMILL